MKNPITDKLVLECFYNFQRDVLNGDGLFCRKPYQRLMKRTKMHKDICLKACQDVVTKGFVTAADKTATMSTLARTDELITPLGRKVLGVSKNADVRHSDKPKGPQLLIEGWKW